MTLAGDQFLHFLRSLSERRDGYCLGCLSELYGEPESDIDTYLREGGIVGRLTDCKNCGEQQRTFRASPSS